MQTRTHLTERSSNGKTGKMPVSTSSKLQCPATCPMAPACYASTGPLALHWAKVTDGTRGDAWETFLDKLEALEPGQPFRHNQAGDLLDPNTPAGALQLAELAAAANHLKGWTYTHHKPTTLNAVTAIHAATDDGFTVNLSTESVEQADAMVAAGFHAVAVVASTETRTAWTTPGGNRAVLCPAQRVDSMTCSRCQLCHKRPQNVVVAFAAHGTRKRAADSIVS